MITLRGPILVSRKLAMRHGPDIGSRCCSTCSKITSFSDEKHEADDNPSPHPCTPCVIFERPRACQHHAHMCFNMRACCRYTRECFECTHGDVISVSHTHTHNNTRHNTRHNNTRRQRKKTDKERETEREEKEDRDTDRERREDKTKREERRRRDKR